MVAVCGAAGLIGARKAQAQNCAQWADVGGGLYSSFGVDPCGFKVLDIGNGPRLYCCGLIDNAGGVFVSGVAVWDGTNWAALPSLGYTALAVEAWDDGTGMALYAAGDGPQISKLTPSGWARVGTYGATSINPQIFSMRHFNDGTGEQLYVVGSFYEMDYVPMTGIARWSPASGWTSVAGGLFPGVGGGRGEMSLPYDFGGGTKLVVGGGFSSAGGVANTAVLAGFDSAGWNSVGFPQTGITMVRNAAIYNGDLYVCGDGFLDPATLSYEPILRWHNGSWSYIHLANSNQWQPTVWSLAVYDDGSGPQLYASGTFVLPDNSAANFARYDGTTWSPVGSRSPFVAGGYPTGILRTLAVFDDGRGPGLFIGGDFDHVDGVAISGIARWGPKCYANCDCSTGSPLLNVSDYICFQTKYAAGDPYANCDGSTVPPVLNAADFICYLNRYSAGCP